MVVRMSTHGLICLIALSLDFSGPQPAAGAANEWTKPTSGSWEEANWSLDVLPDATQSVLFNNAGWKALVIGAGTAQNFPQSMSVQSLTVGAPVDSYNTLLMNWSGFERPLQTTLLTIGSNSAVLVQGSSLEVTATSTNGSTGNLRVGGRFYHGDYSQVKVFGSLNVALRRESSLETLDPGAYFLTNGTLSVDQSESMGGFGPGKFVQYGGSNNVGSIQVNMEGEYNMYGGQATVTNGITVGLGDFAVSNGVLKAGGLTMNLAATGRVAVVSLYGGSFAVSNVIAIGWGNVLMSGGLFQSPGISVFYGELRQSGGTNEMGAITLPGNRISAGQANYYLSGGTLLSSNLSLGMGAAGGFAGLNGVFEQSGGVHSNSGGIKIWGTQRQAVARPNGEYRLSAGVLVTPLIQLPTGAFSQSGGTNRAGILALEDGSTFALSGGSLYTTNASVGSRSGRYYYWSDLRSIYTQTGGSHATIQFSSTEGGIAQLQGGSLTAPSITVGPEGELELTGAAVTNSGTFTILSAVRVRADGNYPRLGKLILQSASPSLCCPPPSSDSLLDFGFNGATLRFQDSHDTTWDSKLFLMNWSGSANGGGTDHLYVGSSSQGLTAAQLSQLTFVNPVGWPAGNYPARILSTGEIIPAVLPPLAVTRNPDALILSWTGDYQLQSSTNATGPYVAISGASSVFTNPFVGPQRFFRLGLPAP